jgi:hypothetical protein
VPGRRRAGAGVAVGGERGLRRPDPAEGQHPLGVAFFLEELLASGQEVELGDQPDKVPGFMAFHDRQDAKAESGHPVGDPP